VCFSIFIYGVVASTSASLRCAALSDFAVGTPDAVCKFCNLIEIATRRDAKRLLVGDVGVWLGEFIAFLEEEPMTFVWISAAPPSAHEHPAAMEFFSAQLELQAAVAVTFPWIADGFPRSSIPQQDRSAAIFAGRNNALKAAVLQRMVLNVHRQPLRGGVKRRPFGDGPAFQNAIEFQTKVVVQMRRGMLLDNERQLLVVGDSPAPRFRRDAEIPLASVFGESHGGVVGFA